MKHDIMNAPVKEQALQKLLELWKPVAETEYVTLEQCLDRVAAEDIRSVNMIPAVRISAMDGYAVKSAAFAEKIPDVASWVEGVDYAVADTGDDFPDEFDAVIAVEMLHYDESGKLVLENTPNVKAGMNIRPAGCMMQPGDLLVSANTKITPELQANLAVGGIKTVPVKKCPIVAFIPTGSELIPAGSEPERGKNIECNSFLISAYLRKWGAEVISYPIVNDEPERIEGLLNEALRLADIVILCGGSSKGTEDYTSRMMEHRASYLLHGVRTVPGRPVGISIIGKKPVINMPGPTLAAWVVNDWLLKPMICHYYGLPTVKRPAVSAILTEDFKKGPPVEVYTRVALEKCGETYYATPLGRDRRTSELLRDGIGLLVAPIGASGWQKGQSVIVELLVPEELIPRT